MMKSLSTGHVQKQVCETGSTFRTLRQHMLLHRPSHQQQQELACYNSRQSYSPQSILVCCHSSSVQRRHAGVACRAAAVEYGQDLGVDLDSYMVLGLAHCFEKNEEGKLEDCMVIEPVVAPSLECMVLGAKTCFKAVTGLTVRDALKRDISILPEEFQGVGARFCNDYEERCRAVVRTWLRPHAQDNLLDLVPLGQTKTKFNFNLDEKRVLNFENEVSDEDNVKQDMSIDVYGRKEKAEAAEPAEAPAAPAPQAEEDDGLDSLLSA